MDETTVELLRELASELGVTAKMLWEALLRQAPIAGAWGLLVVVLAVFLIVVIIRKLLAVADETEDEFEAVFYRAIVVVAGLVALLTILEVPPFLAGIFNPEYWALRHLLGGF